MLNIRILIVEYLFDILKLTLTRPEKEQVLAADEVQYTQKET